MSTDPWQLWRELALKAAGGWSLPAGTAGIPGFPPGAAAPAAFERFAAELRNYFEQLAAAAGTPGAPGATPGAAPSEAARRFGDRLREQLEQAGPLSSALLAPLAALSAGVGGAPALGALREHQERAERLMQAALRAQEAQQRLQRLWSDALREAALAFSASLPTGAAEATPEALHALYNRWIECAEQAYARIAHGADFCQALAELVNATSAWRAECQAGYEAWAKSLDLPTRSEVNSINLRLSALEAAQRAPAGTASKPRTRKAKRR